MRINRSLIVVVAAAWLARMWGSPCLAQERVERGSPPAHVRERMDAIERLMESRNDESIAKFVQEQLSPELRSSKSQEEWIATLKEARKLYQGFGTVQVRPDGESKLIVRFGECAGEDTPLHIGMESSPPHLLNEFRLGEREAETPRERAETKREPAKSGLTWDTLRDRLSKEETNGFSGSVLVARDGEIVLHEGYGLCNREKNIRCGPETVFAVGSVPIDFTKAAILMLENMGKLRRSNSISEFLPNVPEDKKDITIEQLMTGRSGLRNFHGRPTDADLDHAWIDRDTAVKRILEDDLLFPPGTDKAHSHSAFGLLAAIVEIVSEQSYGDFLDKYMFSRAEMKKTRLYEDAKFPEEEVAVGYGGAPYGAINSPLHWGRTSWLVLGSGGMVSTTGDLQRWVQAIRTGKTLNPHSAQHYWSPPGSVLSGASDNGFVASYTEGPGSMMVLLSNSGLGNDRIEQLVRDLAALVNNPKYRVGLLIDFSPEAIKVGTVEEGSPAYVAGLRSGDEILAVNGTALDPDAGPDPLLEIMGKGESVELKVKRTDGTVYEVKVKPELR